MLPYFDEKIRLEELSALPKEARIAFAAACAQRLTSGVEWAKAGGLAYQRLLRRGLAVTWDAAEGVAQSTTTVASLLAECDALLKDEDEGAWSTMRVFSEHAITAVRYALSMILSGSAQEALWAARQNLDALDYYVSDSKGLESWSELDEKQIAASSLVQREVGRQQRDISELTAVASRSNLRMAVKDLRRRAEEEAATLFSS